MLETMHISIINMYKRIEHIQPTSINEMYNIPQIDFNPKNILRYVRSMVQAIEIMLVNLRCTNGVLGYYGKQPFLRFNFIDHVIPYMLLLHE